MKVKAIGTVVSLPAGGFVAVATHYPAGKRKLPQPRLLADGVYPFKTQALALRQLEKFKADPMSVRHTTIEKLQPLPDEIVVTRINAAAPKPKARRVRTTPPAPLPPAEKLVRIIPAGICAHASLDGVAITKLPEMVRRSLPAGKMMGA